MPQMIKLTHNYTIIYHPILNLSIHYKVRLPLSSLFTSSPGQRPLGLLIESQIFQLTLIQTHPHQY